MAQDNLLTFPAQDTQAAPQSAALRAPLYSVCTAGLYHDGRANLTSPLAQSLDIRAGGEKWLQGSREMRQRDPCRREK